MSCFKFNKLMNNCYYMELGDKTLLISYESIIGVVRGDVIYINERYIKFSRTTSKHINLFKREFYYNLVVSVNEEYFYKLVNN